MKKCFDAKLKDKISLEREDSQWFMALMEYWGEQKGKAFFQKLRAQNPRIDVQVLYPTISYRPHASGTAYRGG
jgi:hypothetical protein